MLVFHTLVEENGTNPLRLAPLPSDIPEQVCAAETPVAHSITSASIAMRSAHERLRLNRNRAVAMILLLDDLSRIRTSGGECKPVLVVAHDPQLSSGRTEHILIILP
jgi:hypothetical protein